MENDNTKLKVLMISRDPSWDGGVVHFVNGLLSNFTRKIDVERFFIGQRKGFVGSAFRLVVPAVDAVRLFFRVSGSKFEVIHLNPSLEPRAILRDLLMLFSIRIGSPDSRVIVFFHGWESRVVDWLAKKPFARRMFVSCLDRASRVIVLAHAFKVWLVSIGLSPERILVYSTAFDGEIFNGVKRVRHDSKIRIVFLARLIKEKGIFELIEAFYRLANKNCDLRLVIAGDGPALAGVMEDIGSKRLEDKIHVTGYIQGKKKAEMLVNADLFVFPSYSEGCPVALLEAMAAGLPVVVTSVGGIPDILEDGINGVLINDHSPESIENGVGCLLDDPVMRKRCGEANYVVAWRLYESKIVAQKVEALYKTIVDEQS